MKLRSTGCFSLGFCIVHNVQHCSLIRKHHSMNNIKRPTIHYSGNVDIMKSHQTCRILFAVFSHLKVCFILEFTNYAFDISHNSFFPILMYRYHVWWNCLESTTWYITWECRTYYFHCSCPRCVHTSVGPSPIKILEHLTTHGAPRMLQCKHCKCVCFNKEDYRHHIRLFCLAKPPPPDTIIPGKAAKHKSQVLHSHWLLFS